MVNIPKISKVADSLTFKHIQNPNTVYTLFLTKYLKQKLNHSLNTKHQP